VDKAESEWRGKGFSFFANKTCEFFPCHAGVDPDGFNCLFCFCPLYPRGDCGGDFVYKENGVKDCGACAFPHARDSYGAIIKALTKK
jgi:Zn-finger protein